ncbi:MAG TPA: hypothetical protein VJ691_02535 [Vicinamibacterales bacterium]|nr:hypothetical protein [Vicinamibacterales bacterium]
MSKSVSLVFALALLSAPAFAQSVDYQVLATAKTSTMEKEMNEAGAAGYKFMAVMGGETAIGGKEVVVLMQKGGDVSGKFRYKLLATSRTGTLQKEMSAAALDGYDYVGQTVFESLFGGEEVVSIMERGSATESEYVYKLIATAKTSTLQKELLEIGKDGYQALGMTVGKTALGGSELVVIARKKK